MGEESKRTLIVAGSALELIINLTNNMVTSVDLNFPDSGESVDKHAPASARILHQDLKLAPNQSPLTKKLDQFVPNFERLAILDRLSSNPGLNLYQAVAGLFVSLERLCQWELQNTRENPALAGKSDQFIKNLVLCTRSGFPAMNAGGRVGFSLEYWTENRLQPTATPRGECRPELWAIIIACGPLRDLAVNPVRISDKWISAEIVKAALPGNSQTGPILDWQEPENTFIQPQEQAKAPEGVGMHAGTSLLGPRLAEVVFTAVLDPPIHIPYSLWEQTRQLGCVPVAYDTAVRTFDSMLFPAIPGTAQVFKDDRVITRRREVHVFPPGMATSVRKFHANTLFVRKKVYGATLSELSFSHPQQVVSLLPYLRQYVFLATLLKNSFGEDENGSSVPGNQDGGIDELAQFPGPHGSPAAETAADWRVDIALFLDAMPRMRVVFPFRERMADVEVEIGENGSVHVVAQDVLDEKNTTAPNGRQRRPEDVGKLLETLEDIGEWCEWMSMRWA